MFFVYFNGPMKKSFEWQLFLHLMNHFYSIALSYLNKYLVSKLLAGIIFVVFAFDKPE